MGSSFRFRRLVVAAAVAVAVVISAATGAFFTIAQANSVPDKPTGLVTLAGDTQVQLSWDDPEDTLITEYELWQLAQSAKLTELTDDITEDNRFGYSVAVDVDTAVIGVPGDGSTAVTEAGAAYVFTRNTGTGVWSQAAKLTASDRASNDEFGISVAVDGETVVVGAHQHDIGTNFAAGAAYVYTKPGGGWAGNITETAKLTASDRASYDEFGISVAVDGGTVVVGAAGVDGTDAGGAAVTEAGAAYVFTLNTGTGVWSQAAKLTASDRASYDEFGISVAVDGGTVVVGAAGVDGTDAGGAAVTEAGAAYVFTLNTGTGVWSQAAKLTASDRASDDEFGISVAVDGVTVVVGAAGVDGTDAGGAAVTEAGAAYVFTLNTGTGVWSQAAKLTASDRASDDEFGISVAVDGETVVVGAHKHDIGSKSNAGAAYVYIKPGSVWADATESAKPTASGGAENDEFGSSVAVDGDTVLVGAYAHDNGDSETTANSGAAYVFDTTDWYDIAVVSKDQKISHIVTGLTNDMGHNFRIRAENSNGFSDPSGYVVETPKAYAPARPVNFSAEQTGVGEVKLTWDAHLYPLTVAGYEYRQDDGSWTAIAESDSSTVSHTVTGLTAGTTYTFAVRAVNSAFSTASDSRSVTIVAKPGEPDPFITVAGDGHVWLGWRSPGDFSISGYQYRQREWAQDVDNWTDILWNDWNDILDSRAETTFHIVTGLSNGTLYQFEVRAVNAAGESDSSDQKDATPAEATLVPAKPGGFSVKQVGDGEVELTWKPSANPLNVTVYQFKQDTGSWVDIDPSDHSTVSHLVSGLTDGTTYNFAVRAKNSVGNGGGSSSQSVTVVPKPAAPTWPTEGAAEEGDTQVGLTWSNPVNAPITGHQLLQFPESINESIKLISTDRSAGDELGWSVAVDGDTLVMGALSEDGPNNTGAAYVFTRDAGGWTQMGKLTAAVREEDAGFGYSVAVDGDTIVVGAYEEDHVDPDGDPDHSDVGAAYVFTKPADGWANMTETARLIASEASDDPEDEANDEFGTSVAVHGDTIVVGAAEEDVSSRGSAYIFTKSGDVWGNASDSGDSRVETARLVGNPGGDRFGRSVAVHGNTIVVGAPEEGNKKGAAYVFTKSAATGVWDDWDDKKARDATAKLTANNRGNDDRFGVSVGMDGDTIVVGAYFADSTDEEGDTVSNSGAAYVFTKVSGVWSQVAKLTASDGAATDEFGISVAVDGDIVVVGAHQDDANGNNSGSAYVFTKPETGWATVAGTAQLTAYDGRGGAKFGYSVAADGGVGVVGAPLYDGERGSAYVFGTEAVWTDIPGGGAGTTSYIATGLANKAEHTFQVRAVNAAGAGAASDSVDKTPKAATAVPVKPEEFSATQIGVGQVKLVWGLISRLTVTGYQYSQNDGADWTNIDGSDSGTTSHTVTGLTAGTSYAFAVRGVNGAVTATKPGASSASASVTPEAQLGAPSGFTADAGDTQVTLGWVDPADNSINIYQLLQRVAGKLTAADGLRDDQFGYSVAVDGDTAVIGAYQDDHTDENGTVNDTGAAYVFTKNSDGTWSQTAKLTAPGRAENDKFGYSVAVDGDTVVVGAYQPQYVNSANETVSRPGAAYVFTEPNGGWKGQLTETVKLIPFGAAANDEFGISVAVDGNTILVGAHQNDADTNNNNEGAAYIFTRFADVWGNAPVSGDHRVETAKLIPSDAAPGDRFGISVAVDGDTAVIGAHQDDDNSDGSGSAYVFTKVSGVWGQQAKLVPSDGAADDYFGFSVGVDGDSIVVGAYGNDANDDDGLESNDIANSGSGYVFTRDANNEWSQAAKLVASDAEADDQFGYSVAVDGETVLVGAYQDDENGDQSGSVYVFTGDSEGMWSQTAKRTAPDGAAGDGYGYSVAISGTNVLVGAYSADRIYNYGTKVPDTGAAYFWSISDWADIPDSGGGTTSYDVPGLTNGVEYAFQVRGVNDAGAGLASASASGIPQIPKPGQPTGLDVEAGDTQVTVSWNLPSGDAPPIDKYQLLQVPLSKLTADVPEDNDEFGYSVGIDGDTAVVGVPGANNRTGAAYVYTKDSRGLWGQAAKLTLGTDGAANDEFGFSVAVDDVSGGRDTVVIGARGNDVNKGAAYVFTEPDGGWANTTSPTAKLTASGGADNDEFGISVAVDGETVVVGAPGVDGTDADGIGVTDAGAAYVYTKPGGAWADATEKAKLTVSDRESDDKFGVSVAIDGDTVVVGAHQRNAKGDDNVGGAYVFTKPETLIGWVDTNIADLLTAADGALNDKFGNSVAIEGDTVVVGAHQHDANSNLDAGGAYVFARDSNSGKWSQEAKLIASDGAASDEFGVSVALDGDKAVVGAHMDDRDGAVTESGSVYVFTRETGAWSETVQLAAPDAFSTDHFGNSVALSGGTVLAGAPLDDDNAADSGSAYVMDVGRTDATIWADVNPLELISDSADYYYRTLGLINDQEYAFRVRAVNAGGSNPSAETRSAMPKLSEPGRPTRLTAEAGRQRVELNWDRSYDSSIDGYQALTLKIDKLTPSDRTEDDNFGWAVAVASGIAVVGAPQDDSGTGAAYVFTRNAGSSWSQAAKLTANDGDQTDLFGYSVAVDGNTIVIGAPQDDDKGADSGAAYVFTKPTTNGGWADSTGAEPAKFTASDGAADDEFGHSVAVEGDTVVVGAHQANLQGPGNTPLNNSGAAYVFTKPPLGWATGTETAKLTESVSGRALHDRFGQSVAVQSTDDGDTVVVGAHLDEGNGSVFVFTEPGSGWASGINETAKLTASDGMAGDQFGYSVALDGTTLVVGARGDDTNVSNSGSAYVFTEPDTMDGWKDWNNLEDADEVELTAKLTASDGQANDYFGYSVAVHGDVVVIGAYAADIDPEYSDENLSSGAAYVFTKPGNAWVEGTETAKLILPNSDGMDGTEEDDDFGNSVAVDSESIIVGAPFDDVVVEDNQEVLDAGSMYALGIPRWAGIDPSNDTTTSHTVYELIGGVEYTFQVRAVDEAGSSPPSNIVHATPRGSSGGGTEPRNYGPSFVSGNNLTPAVDENAPPGTLVGSPITATDPDPRDVLTYFLQGTDAPSFGINPKTGQLRVNASLDYESKSKYQVTIRVSDNENPSVVVDVDITVTNLDETGTIALSSQQAKVGTALTAEVSDPDGSVTGVTWQWASSPDLVNWQNIAGATSTTYTPVAQDMDRFLRVTVSYADGEGSGKQEQFNFGTAVQGLPVPTPTPEPPERDERPTPGPRSTPEPTAAPTVKPTRVAERPAVPRPEAMARPTPETSGIPMPETGAIFVPEPTLLPTPALAPVGTPVLAQNPTAIPTPTTAPAPATPQVAPDDEGGVNGWLITLLAGGAVAIAAGTFFVVWIRG